MKLRWAYLLSLASLLLPLSLTAGEPEDTTTEQAETTEEVTTVEETRGDVLVIEEKAASTETDTDDPTHQVEIRDDLPTRGMSMERVISGFGEPAMRHAAVGEPPITRWDYPGFSVFFEFDKVLHSVAPE